MATAQLSYTAAQIDAAIAKITNLIVTNFNLDEQFAEIKAGIGYFDAIISNNAVTVPSASGYKLMVGGSVLLKMPSAGTGASTLQIGTASSKDLWYNGAAVSAQNTWEENEIISVFYDGTRFMASNSQGGGGKAEKIKYDNSQSGLVADNVQGALDEVAENLFSEIEISLSGYSNIGYAISSGTKRWTTNADTQKHILVPITAGSKYIIEPNATYGTVDIAWLTSTSCVAGYLAPLVEGTNVSFIRTRTVLTAPETATYLYIRTVWDSVQYRPAYFGKIGSIIDKHEEEINEILSKEVLDAEIVDSVKANSQDLVTGGAIFDKFKGIMQPVSLNFTSSLDVQRKDRWIDGTRFSSSTTGKHVVIPIEDNYETVNILGHSSKGSYYVFVRSYEVPESAVSFDLCKGETGRRIIAANTSTGTIKIPGDCKYIIIGILNDNSNSYKPQSVTIGAYVDVNYSEKLSDLYLNTLRSALPDELTSGDEYWGDRIKVNAPNRKHYCTHYGIVVTGIGGYTPPGGTRKSQQGLAIYDKYAFITYDYGYIRVFDMETREFLATYEMPEGVFGPRNHAGNANFTDTFYDESDQFPLLYISSYLENCCYVLRVTLEGCSLVQTIYVSLDDTDTIHTGTWHFYPDCDERIIVHGSYGFCLGVLPKIGNATAFVHIPQCTVLRNVARGYTLAGAAARNGNLYMNAYTGSTGNWDYSTLLVYNYEQMRIASRFTVPNNIHGWEFEGLAFYGNQIVVGYNGHDQFMVYRF